MKDEKNTIATGPDTLEKMRMVGNWLHEKQGKDIVGLDVRGICSITEGLVVASAGSMRHAQALSDFVLDMASENNVPFMGIEGYKSGAWILVDMNDVLVHIFQDDSRGFYNLEGLWGEAEKVELHLPEEEEDDFDIDDF